MKLFGSSSSETRTRQLCATHVSRVRFRGLLEGSGNPQYAARKRRYATRNPQHAPGFSEQGIALVIVMISIFVLTILAGGFAYSMKVETRLAHNANSETELEWLGRSGIEKARWILGEQLKISQEPYDGLDQIWAGGPGGIGTSNSALAQVQLNIEVPNGRADITIIDLERKANINTASEAILQQALMVMNVDAGEMTPIVNCILDWIDPDESPRIQGAESDAYQNSNRSYSAKDGPIDDLSELLMIKGISPELYYGSSATNYQQQTFRPQGGRFAQAAQGGPTYSVGLTNLFTPLSDGKININTASAEVLQLIPLVTPEAAEGIVAARAGEADGSGLNGPYLNIGQVRRVPEVSLPMAGAIQQFCDVRSKTFEVHVKATVNGYTRDFVGVLGRNTQRDIQILSFYWIN
jgi:general secretion pathway protein K